jgi:hypothetical protein
MIATPYGHCVRDNAADPIFNKNVFLLPGNGANGGTSFPDRSMYARTFTPNGNVQTSTAQSKIGDSSILCDGAGDYLTTPYAAEISEVSTVDFTCDFWFRPNSQTVDQALVVYALGGISDGSQCAFAIAFFGATSLGGSTRKVRAFAFAGTSQTNLDSTTLLTAGTWYHIAFSRARVQSSAGGTFYLHINGVREASAVDATLNASASHELRIGRYETTTTRYIDGNIGPVRMCLKRWRYNASNFESPRLPFATF